MTTKLWGQEQLVNVTTTSSQYQPSICRLTNGDLVIAWADTSPGNSDIKARIYGADGQAKSGELTLVSGTSADVNPTVIALADGGFQLAYERDGVMTFPTFNPNGTADGFVTGIAFIAGTGDTSGVALGGGEGFVVAYTFNSGTSSGGKDVAIVRFDSTGASLGTTGLTTGVAGDQVTPDIAQLNGGNLVVVWSNGYNQVQYQMLTSAGVTVGAVVNVNASGGDDGYGPEVTALESGGFVVTWTDFGGLGGSSYDIRASVYDASGTLLSGNLLVNGRVQGSQYYGDVVALQDGGFLSVYYSNSEIMGQQFNSLGQRVDGEFLISTTYGQISDNRSIVASLMADGRVAVSWDTFNGGLGDDSGTATHLQIIDPRDGNIMGTLAADLIYGGDFADQIVGLGGGDLIYAGFGDDVVHAGQGGDTVYGQVGSDVLFGDDGDDALYGGFDGDWIEGGAGNDFLYGEEGDDQLYGGAGADLIQGGDGADRMAGFVGNDQIEGGAGNDLLYGEDGDDQLYGGDGDDVAFGGIGADRITGYTGNDTIFGEDGGDLIYGEDGNDVLYGGAGGDTIYGGTGADRIAGGSEADAIYGEDGGDLIYGEGGGDYLIGGAGGDTFAYLAAVDSYYAGGVDTIADFNLAEGDRIDLTLIDANTKVSGDQAFTLFSGFVTGRPGQAVLYVNGANTFFEGDTDGDGVTDFVIVLAGNHAGDAAGFLL